MKTSSLPSGWPPPRPPRSWQPRQRRPGAGIALFLRGEQVVAPGDGVAQGLLPHGGSALPGQHGRRAPAGLGARRGEADAYAPRPAQSPTAGHPAGRSRPRGERSRHSRLNPGLTAFRRWQNSLHGRSTATAAKAIEAEEGSLVGGTSSGSIGDQLLAPLFAARSRLVTSTFSPGAVPKEARQQGGHPRSGLLAGCPRPAAAPHAPGGNSVRLSHEGPAALLPSPPAPEAMDGRHQRHISEWSEPPPPEGTVS